MQRKFCNTYFFSHGDSRLKVEGQNASVKAYILAASAGIWHSDYRRVGGRRRVGGGRKRRWANQLILKLESRNLAGI